MIVVARNEETKAATRPLFGASFIQAFGSFPNIGSKSSRPQMLGSYYKDPPQNRTPSIYRNSYVALSRISSKLALHLLYQPKAFRDLGPRQGGPPRLIGTIRGP